MKRSSSSWMLVMCLVVIYSDIFTQDSYVLSADNPFALVALSNFAAPALGDIDADGDLDLFVGQYNSNDMLFYRNIGDAQNPEFEQQFAADNPLDIYSSNSGGNAPALVDIDADGDLDVFVGIWTYIIRHLSNTGDATTPDFVFQEGANNPLDQVMTEGICSFPAFLDIDDDMDQDVFISDGNGNIDFYENTGDQNTAVFVLDTINNVFGDVELSARAKIAFHDVSGDGLPDAVISHDISEPELLYFENTGTLGNAVFEERTGQSNPFNGITGMEALVPAFADIDMDGDKDLILGTWLTVRLYEAVKTSRTTDIEAHTALKVYPNPAVKDFTVYSEGTGIIEVADQQGRLVMQLPASGSSTHIDMTREARGMYFIRLVNQSGIAISKVVLQ